MITSSQNEWKGISDDLRRYFALYGGWSMLLGSPYTQIAVLITVLSTGTWLRSDWTALPLLILPNLLGFALAAYALLLGFGDERFRSFLAVTGEKPVPGSAPKPNLLLSISAIFLHFLVVQILALSLGIVWSAPPLAALLSLATRERSVYRILNSWPLHFVRSAAAALSYFLFALAITTSLNAALNIFHATRWYVDFKDAEAEAQKPPKAL